MATVLTEQGEMTLAATNGLWLSADDAERATGWTLKPEGMCRDDLCVPLPVRDGRVDVAAFWRRLGQPVVHDAAGETWVLGAGAEQRNERAGGTDGAGLHAARSGRRAAHAVGAAGEEGVPLYLGLLVRLSL